MLRNIFCVWAILLGCEHSICSFRYDLSEVSEGQKQCPFMQNWET